MVTTKIDQEKKTRMIQAAIVEFARQGYLAGNTDTIAKNAGVSKGLIYHYFKKKQNLYVAVVETIIGEMTNEILPAFDQFYPNLTELFISSVTFKLELQKKYPAKMKILFDAYGQSELPVDTKESLKQLFQNQMAVGYEIIFQTIKRLTIKKGINFEEIVFAVSAMIDAHAKETQLYLAEHPKVQKIEDVQFLIDRVSNVIEILQFGFLEQNTIN